MYSFFEKLSGDSIMDLNMKDLTGLKISISQMPVVPGRPDINTRYAAKEIRAASVRGSDLIIFPEMIHGYAIGDKFEDECFIADIQRWNEQIREATNPDDPSSPAIAAIFGSVTPVTKKKGRDGRLKKNNSGIIAQGGEWLGKVTKTLHPDYRIFDDDRHFSSTQHEMFEDWVSQDEDSSGLAMEDYFKVITIATSLGPVRIGLIICEDMWHQDYPINPGQILAQQGIDLLVVISASPWTWQKNRKRHQVIKDLAADCREVGCPVPIVYVNNTGIQNNGKNIIIFDGSSTVYNNQGEIIFQVGPYVETTQDYTFDSGAVPVQGHEKNDTEELFSALEYAGRKYINTLPPTMHKVVIGFSGGIDSSNAGAFWSHIVGPENVYGISMPGPYTSEKTQNLGAKLAENLGCNFEVEPVGDIADLIAQKRGIERGTLAYENILARCRMEILAATAQKLGGVFTNNGNKVEAAFGYCTRYADNAGLLAAFADLVKREMYQLGDYMNREVYKRQVIPEECFTIAPSAELNKNQKDPFDYGNLERRGYHDELVRSFTEFRFNPEKVVELYLNGRLEEEFRLEAGHLAKLFTSSNDFIKDLEKSWRMFHDAYSKRVETQPIPIISKRAFGFDLRESMLSSYFTQRYYDLKQLVLSRTGKVKRVIIYGGGLNPSALHHLRIVTRLNQISDEVIVVPCGSGRKDKLLLAVLDAQRADMAKLTFKDLPNVRLDLFDLEDGSFTPTWKLQEKYQQEFPDAQIWHVIGGDIVTGGSTRNSEIHRVWDRGNEIWGSLNFIVINRPGYKVERDDLPPSSELIEIDNIFGSSTMIRERRIKGESISDLVTPEVEEYINVHGLYL